MFRPLAVALVLAIVVFFATRRPFLAVAVFALVVWWMNAQTGRRPPTVRVDPSSVEPPDPADREGTEPTGSVDDTDADDGVEVRCDLANDRLQRWVSLTTGRGYEVPPERGIRGAEPGMRGVVVVRDGKISVRAVASLDDA